VQRRIVQPAEIAELVVNFLPLLRVSSRRYLKESIGI
jgi:hypothetical protein